MRWDLACLCSRAQQAALEDATAELARRRRQTKWSASRASCACWCTACPACRGTGRTVACALSVTRLQALCERNSFVHRCNTLSKRSSQPVVHCAHDAVHVEHGVTGRQRRLTRP